MNSSFGADREGAAQADDPAGAELRFQFKLLVGGEEIIALAVAGKVAPGDNFVVQHITFAEQIKVRRRKRKSDISTADFGG